MRGATWAPRAPPFPIMPLEIYRAPILPNRPKCTDSDLDIYIVTFPNFTALGDGRGVKGICAANPDAVCDNFYAGGSGAIRQCGPSRSATRAGGGGRGREKPVAGGEESGCDKTEPARTLNRHMFGRRWASSLLRTGGRMERGCVGGGG